jgi:hypothetical protein
LLKKQVRNLLDVNDSLGKLTFDRPPAHDQTPVRIVRLRLSRAEVVEALAGVVSKCMNPRIRSWTTLFDRSDDNWDAYLARLSHLYDDLVPPAIRWEAKDEDCPVCCEVFPSHIESDEPWLKTAGTTRALCCERLFHSQCLRKWFDTTVSGSPDQSSGNCPMCRGVFDAQSIVHLLESLISDAHKQTRLAMISE